MYKRVSLDPEFMETINNLIGLINDIKSCNADHGSLFSDEPVGTNPFSTNLDRYNLDN